MEALRVVLTIAFILICIALAVIVLMQKGKDGGMGALTGGSNSYWAKNRGRSLEGNMIKITAVLGALFIIIALVLNLKF